MAEVKDIIYTIIICMAGICIGYLMSQQECESKLDKANRRIKELESRLEQPMTLTKPIKMVRMRGMHLECIDISLKGLWSGGDTIYTQGGSK